MKDRFYGVDIEGMSQGNFSCVAGGNKAVTWLVGPDESLIVRFVPLESKKAYRGLPSVKPMQTVKDSIAVYTDGDGNKVPVPQGWMISGETSEQSVWGPHQGVVAYRIPKMLEKLVNFDSPVGIALARCKFDQMVWVPVDHLPFDGIVGEKVRVQYGARSGVKVSVTKTFIQKSNSIRKYGGFWVARYLISGNFTCMPKSRLGRGPWTWISRQEAVDLENWFLGRTERENGKIFLLEDSDYDTITTWLIASGTISREVAVKDSSRAGNYCRYCRCGADKRLNNLYGWTGNVRQWTSTEKQGQIVHVRGGSALDRGPEKPINYCENVYWDTVSNDIGFRYAYFLN